MGSQEQNSENEKKYGVGFCFGIASAENWKQNPTPLGVLTSITLEIFFSAVFIIQLQYFYFPATLFWMSWEFWENSIKSARNTEKYP